MARRYSRYNRYESGYESRRRSFYRRERRNEERHIELVSFGLILGLFMLTLLVPTLGANTALILLLGGAILLGGAFAQSQRRFRVNPTTWIGGGAMLIFGVIGLQSPASIPLGGLLPILILGVVIAASFLTGEF